MLSLLLLLHPILAQGEGPVACLESGACFQVNFGPINMLIFSPAPQKKTWATDRLYRAPMATPRLDCSTLLTRRFVMQSHQLEAGGADRQRKCMHLYQLRFVAPEPYHPEEGLWDASTESTIICPKKSDWYDPAWEVVGDEDCLFLNVYTPENHQQSPLPVMVWIHGGALVTGSGTYQEHGPQHLLDKWVA